MLELATNALHHHPFSLRPTSPTPLQHMHSKEVPTKVTLLALVVPVVLRGSSSKDGELLVDLAVREEPQS